MDLIHLAGTITTIVGATWYLSAKLGKISERLAVLELQVKTLWAPLETKKASGSRRK